MSIARQIGAVSSSLEVSTRAKEFAVFAKTLLESSVTGKPAADVAEDRGLRVVADRFKTAVNVGATTGPWADVAADGTARAWLASLGSYGVFDRMLGSMNRIPLKTNIVVVSAGATAYTNGQGSLKRLSKIDLGSGVLEPIRVDAVVVVSEELIRAGGDVAASLFDAELRRAVVAETDNAALTILLAGASSVASSGAGAAAVRTDIGAALDLAGIDVSSKLFIVVDPSTAKDLSILGDAGATAFPGMSPTGGMLFNVPVLVSSASAVSGKIVVIDANGLAGASMAIDVSVLRQASLQMDSAPDSPPTASTIQINLFQQNLRALAAQRYFGLAKLRSNAVTVVSSVGYSPA